MPALRISSRRALARAIESVEGKMVESARKCGSRVSERRREGRNWGGKSLTFELIVAELALGEVVEAGRAVAVDRCGGARCA